MDYDLILQGILDIGEEMVVAGAEVNRVEDSILRMGKAYGYDRMNVFIIVSNLQVTAQSPDGRIITQIRNICRNDVNFDRLDYLNNLSRYVVGNVPDVDELQDELNKVLNRPQQNKWLNLLGCILVASFFTVFFGGGWRDAIAAGIMAIVIISLRYIVARNENNQIVINFILSFVGGVVALALVRIGLGLHSDLIMIGGIMLLIPGIAMTNAVRDMLIGDTASGLLRLFNSFLVAMSIAAGFAMSIVVLGGAL